MSYEFKLPIIDISAFTIDSNSRTEKLKIAKQIYEACRNVGFFYLIGHNVPQEIIDKVLKLGYEFFHLPEEEKIKYSIANEDYARGYQRLGENVTRYKKDWHEALDFYKPIPRTHPLVLKNLPLRGENQWPENPSEFRAVFSEYIDYMLKLGALVMSAIALGLGLEENYFEKFLEESFWVMRVIGYPDLKNIADKDRVGVSCGEHTGDTLIILNDNTKEALQVQTKDGNWINADPLYGSFVVNIGDMLNIWTNDIYKSTLHRVIHKGDSYRVSVPFFYEPNYDAKIEPLEACLQIDPVKHHEPVVYGEHLLKKVSTNFEIIES
ncbi:Clavaminate synthase-like protein [Rhizophagus irregularis]|uniref:Clavaminate synthase-like protein n=1 Tax=Rhizophagus irregularis TaxID=588596 RepID=A0A2I1FT34_9GLOM|nr:Clavaminate synthase-like protein [Rhizophagus irregularis]PKY37539.1 Clavaminate synthase-like protein [Rhizophagus irregularis]